MATYLWSDYSLEFQDDFETLAVVNDSNQTNHTTFDLTGSTAVKIEKASGSNAWEVTQVNCSSCAQGNLHKYDTLGGATLEFTENASQPRLGGLGLIDLRDIGRSGNYEVAYDLGCSPVYVSYVGGARATHIVFEDATCYTQDETGA